jgi:hypothetical protein
VSVAKPNLGIWDGILNEEPAPAATKAVKARLGTFNQHKDVLLDCLRMPSRGPTRAFDATKCWDRLTRLAQVYFLQQAMTPPSERVKRLRRLAEVLDRAHVLAKKAAQDDLGCDHVLSTLFRGTLPRDPGGTIVPNKDGSFRLVYFHDFGLKRMVEDLVIYRAAVLRLSDDVPAARAGKPAILPKNYISALAGVYRANTGREPGASHGPFSRFVKTFLVALHPSYKNVRLDSLIEAIKAVRRERGRL